jgi:hypothetical protein
MATPSFSLGLLDPGAGASSAVACPVRLCQLAAAAAAAAADRIDCSKNSRRECLIMRGTLVRMEGGGVREELAGGLAAAHHQRLNN